MTPADKIAALQRLLGEFPDFLGADGQSLLVLYDSLESVRREVRRAQPETWPQHRLALETLLDDARRAAARLTGDRAARGVEDLVEALDETVTPFATPE